MTALSKPITAIITFDKEVRSKMTQDEINGEMCNLFTSLSRALRSGARVDISDPKRIVVTKVF